MADREVVMNGDELLRIQSLQYGGSGTRQAVGGVRPSEDLFLLVVFGDGAKAVLDMSLCLGFTHENNP